MLPLVLNFKIEERAWTHGRVCTHRGSQDDEDVCVGVSGALLSIELPPELPEHLGASQRLGAHRLSLPASLLSPA